MVVAAVVCVAARYEDFHVTLLRVGDPAIQVSGSATSLLEKLNRGQATLSTNTLTGTDYIITTADGSSTNKGVHTWNNLSVATNADDNSTVTYELFKMNNDSSESLDWADLQVKVIDNTTNTEDSTVFVKILVAGTETVALQLDSAGATVVDLTASDDITATDDLIVSGLATIDESLFVGTTCSVSNSFNFGASVGKTFAVTNSSALGTNIIQWGGGVVTGAIVNGTQK